jgi:hypothetical protein
MSLLALKAYGKLIEFDLCLFGGKFESLYARVRSCQVRRKASGIDIEQVCRAVDVAAIWYPKRVLCLQRSAANVCLLRAHGFPAQLVLGAQKLPFKAHAWVEVQGQVVGDRSYVQEIYAVLDRC